MNNLKVDDLIWIGLVIALFVLPALKNFIVGIIKAIKGQDEDDE